VEDEADFQRQFPDHYAAFADLAAPDDADAVMSAPEPPAAAAAPPGGAAAGDARAASAAARALVEGEVLDDIVALHGRCACARVRVSFIVLHRPHGRMATRHRCKLLFWPHLHVLALSLRYERLIV